MWLNFVYFVAFRLLNCAIQMRYTVFFTNEQKNFIPTLQQSVQKKNVSVNFREWISQNFHVNLISNNFFFNFVTISTVWTTPQIMNTFYHFVRDNHLLAIVETASVKGSVCLNLSNNDLKYVPDNIHTCNRLVKLFLHKNLITKVCTYSILMCSH